MVFRQARGTEIAGNYHKKAKLSKRNGISDSRQHMRELAKGYERDASAKLSEPIRE